jgi:glycosyltransferase involved in cell wall biosynthesis
MIFISTNGFYYNDFDWEMYLTNYRDAIEYKFNTKDKVWWHFLNIGEKNAYLYFDINKREINKKCFDWVKYSENNPYIVFQESNTPQTSDQFWNYFITFNTNINFREQILQQDNSNSQNLLKNKYILYYVGVTCNQNFNTGIQRVVRMLSNYIGQVNVNNEYNIFFVKFDSFINDFVLINEIELNTFTKYNGYNYLKNRSFEEKQLLFQKIKNIPNNLFILPELFYTYHFDMLNNIIDIVNKRGLQSIHIYHDDTIYNNVEMDKKKREELFNKYIVAISKFDIIIPNSKYSETTYLFHKNRLELSSSQKIQHVSLAGEMFNFKRIDNMLEKENYIFSNISVCERKNAISLIKAFNLLNINYPHIKLIICGEVYDDNIYYKSFKNLLNNNIIFISKQSDEKIVDLYKKCLFSVYPSIEEGFGLPIYESLWNNSPVICHNDTSTLEIAREINCESVKCIDCLNEVILFETMKTMLDTDYLNKITTNIKNIKIKTWCNYGKEILELINNNINNINNYTKTIYYYIDHTSCISVRTGVQILTIYLAKHLLKIKTKYNFNVIFVKWDSLNCKLISSNYKELKNFFIFNDDDILIEELARNELYFIDVNQLSNCIFLCPEVPLLLHEKLTNYLLRHNFITVYILHDIIPLVLEDDNYIREKDSFFKYFNNNILKANKLIGVSEFTKNEFIKYCTLNDIHNIPAINSVLLPYQYRNTSRIIHPPILNNSKIRILLPGSIEPRKQQLLVMELFNKFIQNNPFVDVELITFGYSTYPDYIINEQIKKSGYKIKYLGIISNKEMIDLYKNTTFSCFISKYEGYGLPVAESLWHGIPVLTSCIGSMAEISLLGGCYCVNAYNPKDIYEALCILIKNPKIILKLKEELTKSNLTSWDDYAERIYSEICDIIK